MESCATAEICAQKVMFVMETKQLLVRSARHPGPRQLMCSVAWSTNCTVQPKDTEETSLTGKGSGTAGLRDTPSTVCITVCIMQVHPIIPPNHGFNEL